jgi:hypothetical protein
MYPGIELRLYRYVSILAQESQHGMNHIAYRRKCQASACMPRLKRHWKEPSTLKNNDVNLDEAFEGRLSNSTSASPIH